MVSTIVVIITLTWLPQISFEVLNFIYWWQIKEYRVDRFRVFLVSVDGRNKLNLNLVLIKIIFLSLGIILPQLLFISSLLFIYLDFRFLLKLKSHLIRKPVFTQRTRRIFYTWVAFVFLTLIFFLHTGEIFYLLTGEVLSFIAPFIGILWTIPFVNKAKQQDFKKANAVLEKIHPLVIGVTGSYGKTTTKEFIAQLVSTKYITDKTIKNQNTDFGVARKVINDLNAKTEIFVAEMGAYRQGEIKKIAQLLKPDIGVLTGIELQHVELFGSLENIKKAKFELIEALPKKGKAVFNLNNPDVITLFDKAKKLSQNLQVYGYYLKRRLREDPNIKADMISIIKEADIDGIHFTVNDGKDDRDLFTPLKGIHLIENLTGAILVARLLKVPWKDIETSCNGMVTPEGTMTVRKLSYGSVLIDDSYNSTPASFKAALSYLSYFKAKRKAVITPGIIELGNFSGPIHKNIGEFAANITDEMIVTNKEPAEYIKDGFREKSELVKTILSQQDQLKKAEDLIEKGSVILLEGRLPQSLIDFIYKRVI